jgi:hypothetical protein
VSVQGFLGTSSKIREFAYLLLSNSDLSLSRSYSFVNFKVHLKQKIIFSRYEIFTAKTYWHTIILKTEEVIRHIHSQVEKDALRNKVMYRLNNLRAEAKISGKMLGS